MLLTDAEGIPIGLNVGSASPHEVTLIEQLVQSPRIPLRVRTRILYDKAADSMSLRQRLRHHGVRLISPFRKRRNGKTKKLSERDQFLYENRWKVERTISWLKNFRRLVARWEYHLHLHESFWCLGALYTILRGF